MHFAMTQLGWMYEQFMDSTYYFYVGIVKQWIIFNDIKSNKQTPKKNEDENKVYEISELPSNWGW